MTALRDARIASGLTALELADIAGTTEMRVYSVERGRFRPRPGEARRLAVALGANPAEMFPAVCGGRKQ